MAAPQPQVNEQPTITTKSPFDDARADFVLISSDNVAFYVYSALLSLVSPVFEVMFKLPQGVEQELYEGKPFVIHLLLVWCDPRCSKRPLDEPRAILEIADKYGMEDIMELANNSLLDSKYHIKSDALRIFAIAVRFRLRTSCKRQQQKPSRFHCKNGSVAKRRGIFPLSPMTPSLNIGIAAAQPLRRRYQNLTGSGTMTPVTAAGKWESPATKIQKGDSTNAR
ncbi:hypothetical protein CPB83DRAFT_836623 [Crepidotus variabilis]|uniref:BTB domain-containing protein n=1 Tax=Crepidotus variabilis TaxID=179855 RepID=A0A9P6EEA5_9AGAR|nr:hypothetical protein CPB83DRAFT_836623 [Crepidotus variabilis]